MVAMTIDDKRGAAPEENIQDDDIDADDGGRDDDQQQRGGAPYNKCAINSLDPQIAIDNKSWIKNLKNKDFCLVNLTQQKIGYLRIL